MKCYVRDAERQSLTNFIGKVSLGRKAPQADDLLGQSSAAAVSVNHIPGFQYEDFQPYSFAATIFTSYH